MSDNIQICTRCVMDTTDHQIKFNASGYCNHCSEYLQLVSKDQRASKTSAESLKSILAEIKKSGEGQEYDCVIGISGGVDSTYLAYLVVEQFGLRPLAIHLDNGWNSKLAVKNIQNILRKLSIDLETHVIDWEEFKSLQKAYFSASVIDIEAITDHAINATLYQVADDNKVKYILKGFNNVTEKIMPKSWTFNKNDLVNISDINEKLGTVKLDTYPSLGVDRLRYFEKERNIRTVFPYNFMSFDKDAAKKVIMEKLAWVDYGGKHYESVFTRFYQGYILPRKFNVDKRKAHCSNLICAGSMTREEALKELATDPYNAELIREDYEYVIKKLGYTEEEFENILNAPVKSHFDYKTDLKSKIYKKFISPTNPLVSLIKKFKN